MQRNQAVDRALSVARAAARLMIPPAMRVAFEAAFDYHFRRGNFCDKLGGPLNGQLERRRLVAQLLNSIDFRRIYETGTFFGDSTEFFSQHFRGQIITIETDEYFYRFSRLRLRSAPNVHVVHSDSVRHLEHLARNTETSMPSLFYLDAHWYEYLPLRDELALILGAWKRAVVLIDDFEVPNDPGYGFDDYGDGERLCLNYIAPLGLEQMHVFFPSASSAEETGSRRGCVVLTLDGRMAGVLSTLPALRPFTRRA